MIFNNVYMVHIFKTLEKYKRFFRHYHWYAVSQHALVGQVGHPAGEGVATGGTSYKHTPMYVCMYVYMYVCMYTCIHVYM